jgi:hypothetical protein
VLLLCIIDFLTAIISRYLQHIDWYFVNFNGEKEGSGRKWDFSLLPSLHAPVRGFRMTWWKPASTHLEVYTALWLRTTCFSDMMSDQWVIGSLPFEGIYCPQLISSRHQKFLEDEGIIFLRNIGNHLSMDTYSYPRKTNSSATDYFLKLVY